MAKGEHEMRNDKPFIKCFENENKVLKSFDVVIHCVDARAAFEFAKNYFSLYHVNYICSDFDHNHTFHIS